MKNIIKSLAVVVAVSAIAGGATYAYFSDAKTSTGNTFTAGTVVLDINANETYQNGVRTTVPIHFTNLKPGDTMRQWITLHNTGSINIGTLTVQAKNIVDSNGLLDQIRVSIIGYDNNPPFVNNAYFTPGWNTTNGQPVTWMNTPKDILTSAAVQWSPGPVPSVLASGLDDLFVIDYTVPTTMGNAFQGKTATFDMEFYAEQVH